MGTLVIDNTNNFFLQQVNTTLNTLKDTLELHEGCKPQDEEGYQDWLVLTDMLKELINYWELVLLDNGVSL